MPLPTPNLDDRNYDQLTAEGLALIPRNFPQWTDYNPSDPGITLLELFAFVVEAAIYEINRVPDRSLLAFAALAGVTPNDGETITQTLARAQQAAATRTSAVTQSDFENYTLTVGILNLTVQSVDGLAITVSPFNTAIAYPGGTQVAGPEGSNPTSLHAAIPAGSAAVNQITVMDASFASGLEPGDALTVVPIARAKAVVLSEPATETIYPPYEYVDVIVVPTIAPQCPGDDLRQSVYQSLRSVCLIATAIRVTPPGYRKIWITATVVRDLNSRLSSSVIQQNVTQAVQTFLDPLVGGADGNGWPFGRSIYRSELYQLMQNVAGVDHVSELLFNDDELISEIPLRSTWLVKLVGLQITVVDQ